MIILTFFTDQAATLPATGQTDKAERDVAASQGALFEDSHQLSLLIGRATTPLSAAVADALIAVD